MPGDPTSTKKACKNCKIVKPLDEFPNTPRTRDKRESWCKECHKPGQRNRTLLRKYGITADQYDGMVVAQDGKCAACNETAKLVVDHCHKSGKVRALLCDRCNRLLGVADDRIELLQAAIAFLGVHKEA
ncbi:endonuclease VII domain-containing protein [Rhodococcus sp. NPDC006774]|uniref:endonuclease VII domain-containing protein n=1 Tax=Rhodococcus sp. NPDC006774 TaxID=3157186 RepID=UPI0033E2F9E3